MKEIKPCPLCKNKSEIYSIGPLDQLFTIVCPFCGKYNLTDIAIQVLGKRKNNFHIISGITRNFYELHKDTDGFFIIEGEMIDDDAKFQAEFTSKAPKSVPEKTLLLLQYICRKSNYQGDKVLVNFPQDYPICFCKNVKELIFYIKHIRDSGDIKADITMRDCTLSLTMKGWQKVESFNRPNIESKQALEHVENDLRKNPPETEQEPKNSGDTYNINAEHVSLGDKAQHASRDINTITPEPEKERGRWGLIRKISLILGIIVSLIVIVGTCNKYIRKDKPAVKQIESPKTETKQIAEKAEDITLLYLFENDFNKLLRAGGDRICTHKDGSQTTIKIKLYLDFESQTEFVGFYIPSVPETFDICSYLAEHYKIALELTEKVMVQSSDIGLQPVNTSELKFSGRVFIYHEYPLLEAQKRELFALYEKHGLSPQFRDTGYLFKKKQTGRIKDN